MQSTETVRHVSPTDDVQPHELNMREGCYCKSRVDKLPGGYVVIHNKSDAAADIDSHMNRLSTRALEYAIRKAQRLQDARFQDGVFE